MLELRAMIRHRQENLFPDFDTRPQSSNESSTTFVDNMRLPVHRWFRYSAGFSANWVEREIREFSRGKSTFVLDPFAGSGTTLLVSEDLGVESWGVESHPFICRVARAKLNCRSCPDAYIAKTQELRRLAKTLTPMPDGYPPLIYKCYDSATLDDLDTIRQAYGLIADDSPASELTWLTLIGILRKCSTAGTAQWQYVLPRKQKRSPQNALAAFDDCSRMIHGDILQSQRVRGPRAHFLQTDARTCSGVPDGRVNLVITSPPYPNNYDYADATRLEMSFMREIRGWSDLQHNIRRHLIRSCSQHVGERAVDLESVLAVEELRPIRDELSEICHELAEVRKTKGGKKTYHLMIACYFRDLALVWHSLRRVCADGSRVCFVIGDSAPYGVYVPVMQWLGRLATAAGFTNYRFEQTRLRNIKWKNRKHRVPLQEGRLRVEG